MAIRYAIEMLRPDDGSQVFYATTYADLHEADAARTALWFGEPYGRWMPIVVPVYFETDDAPAPDPIPSFRPAAKPPTGRLYLAMLKRPLADLRTGARVAFRLAAGGSVYVLTAPGIGRLLTADDARNTLRTLRDADRRPCRAFENEWSGDPADVAALAAKRLEGVGAAAEAYRVRETAAAARRAERGEMDYDPFYDWAETGPSLAVSAGSAR